jgi:hypothetical protein
MEADPRYPRSGGPLFSPFAIVHGFSEAAANDWGSALVPLGIIADRTRGTAYLGAVIAGIGLIGTFLLVTRYLQGVLGFYPLPP